MASSDTEIPTFCVGWQGGWERRQEWEQKDGGCGERSVGRRSSQATHNRCQKVNWVVEKWVNSGETGVGEFSWMQMKRCRCWKNWEKRMSTDCRLQLLLQDGEAKWCVIGKGPRFGSPGSTLEQSSTYLYCEPRWSLSMWAVDVTSLWWLRFWNVTEYMPHGSWTNFRKVPRPCLHSQLRLSMEGLDYGQKSV